jgi:hypothetical protein
VAKALRKLGIESSEQQIRAAVNNWPRLTGAARKERNGRVA